MSEVRVGCSGWSYKHWRKGVFYPERLKARDELAYYASRFDTAELNGSFYRLPTEAAVAGWQATAPEGFLFAWKASRFITHMKRLLDPVEPLALMFSRTDLLGDKLGPILFQLPHYLKKDVPRLRDFLALLDRSKRVAFDFRNDTWHDVAVYEALREHGAMFCVTDNEEGDTPYVVTAGCAYVRLRREHYEEAELCEWAERIASHGLECTYVYFMHEDEALGCRFARMLADAWESPG